MFEKIKLFLQSKLQSRVNLSQERINLSPGQVNSPPGRSNAPQGQVNSPQDRSNAPPGRSNAPAQLPSWQVNSPPGQSNLSEIFNKNQKNNSFIGFLGEKFAVFWYRLKFYSLIQTNYQSKLGEIDAIFIKGEHIIFLEVKTRLTKFDLASTVSKNQQQRIKNSALGFLIRYPKFRKYSPRIDLFIVTFGRPVIIENAWQ